MPAQGGWEVGDWGLGPWCPFCKVGLRAPAMPAMGEKGLRPTGGCKGAVHHCQTRMHSAVLGRSHPSRSAPPQRGPDGDPGGQV